MIVKPHTNVVQANYLVENRPAFTKDETRLFLTIIATINKDTTDFKPFKIPVSDFAELWGVNPKNAYDAIKNALRGLRNKEFYIEGENPETGKRRFITSSSISTAVYEEGEGYATVEVSSLFKPYLLELKNQYTSYVLKNIMDLSTVNAIRNYELLKQFQVAGGRTFSLEEYRKKLHIENKYPVNADLRRYVIEPSVEEINKKTDIFVTYELIGRGKKANVIFTIVENKPIEVLPEPAAQEENDYDPNQLTLFDEAREEREKICFGFEDEVFAEFTLAQLEELRSLAWHNVEAEVVERHEFYMSKLEAHQQAVTEYIQQKIRLCNATKNVNNRYAFIKKAVSENWK